MEAERNIEVHALHWRGVDIEITCDLSWFESPFPTARLTIVSVAPKEAPLSITWTGFLTHHAPRTLVESAGGPVAYVEGWLDTMARSREWLAHEQSSRQLMLF